MIDESLDRHCDACYKKSEILIATEIIFGIVFVVCPNCNNLFYDLSANRKTDFRDLWSSLI